MSAPSAPPPDSPSTPSGSWASAKAPGLRVPPSIPSCPTSTAAVWRPSALPKPSPAGTTGRSRNSARSTASSRVRAPVCAQLRPSERRRNNQRAQQHLSRGGHGAQAPHRRKAVPARPLAQGPALEAISRPPVRPGSIRRPSANSLSAAKSPDAPLLPPAWRFRHPGGYLRLPAPPGPPPPTSTGCAISSSSTVPTGSAPWTGFSPPAGRSTSCRDSTPAPRSALRGSRLFLAVPTGSFSRISSTGESLPRRPPPARSVSPPTEAFSTSVAESFFRENGAAFTSSRRTPANWSTWRKKAEAVVKDEFNSFLEEYPLLAGRVRKQQQQRLLRDFLRLLDFEWRCRPGLKFREAEFTCGFPDPVRLDLPGRPLFVRGFIDRLDELDGRLFIRDFKSGKARPREKSEAGPTPTLDAQLAVYALLMNAQHKKDPKRWPEVGGVAYFYPDPRGAMERPFIEDLDKLLEKGKEWLAAHGRPHRRTPVPTHRGRGRLPVLRRSPRYAANMQGAGRNRNSRTPARSLRDSCHSKNRKKREALNRMKSNSRSIHEETATMSALISSYPIEMENKQYPPRPSMGEGWGEGETGTGSNANE